VHGQPQPSRDGFARINRVRDPVDSLIVDLLAWLGPEPRPYAEVLETWRTSCPRLPVWETANERGFITRGRGALVSVSPAGAEYLRAAVDPSP
jgi:D-3-phosphoglycerate dehydrogenase / 2-oxoglutarate reductase